MKKKIIILGIFISVIAFTSITCFSQQSTLAKANVKEKTSATITGTQEQTKTLSSFDSTISLGAWHLQQIATYDAEIKRLGATTIEAEQRRLANERQLLINSFITAKVADPSRIEEVSQPNDGKINLKLKPNIKPK